MSEPKTCPKCGQPGWGPTPKWVANRKGKKYYYEIYVHRKRGKMVPHYIRSIEPSQSKELEHSNIPRKELLERLSQDLSMEHGGKLLYKGKPWSKSKKGIVSIVEDLLKGS